MLRVEGVPGDRFSLRTKKFLTSGIKYDILVVRVDRGLLDARSGGPREFDERDSGKLTVNQNTVSAPFTTCTVDTVFVYRHTIYYRTQTCAGFST